MSPKLLVHGSSDFEVSVHMIPSALRREVRHVFPVLGCDRNLMIVATNQKAEQDLVNWGEDVSQEKVNMVFFSPYHLIPLSCVMWFELSFYLSLWWWFTVLPSYNCLAFFITFVSSFG